MAAFASCLHLIATVGDVLLWYSEQIFPKMTDPSDIQHSGYFGQTVSTDYLYTFQHQS